MTSQPRRKDDVSHTLMRIQADVAALVCAVIGGVGLFAMTIWLVIKGGPGTGQHLQLLSNYFVGYSVTWAGAFLGLLYGAVTGGFIGWVIGRIYNGVVSVRKQ